MAIRKEYNQSWSPYWLNMPNDGTGNIPIASENTLGGIKVGAGLSIDSNGVLTADATSLTEEQVAALKAILNIQ